MGDVWAARASDGAAYWSQLVSSAWSTVLRAARRGGAMLRQLHTFTSQIVAWLEAAFARIAGAARTALTQSLFPLRRAVRAGCALVDTASAAAGTLASVLDAATSTRDVALAAGMGTQHVEEALQAVAGWVFDGAVNGNGLQQAIAAVAAFAGLTEDGAPSGGGVLCDGTPFPTVGAAKSAYAAIVRHFEAAKRVIVPSAMSETGMRPDR